MKRKIEVINKSKRVKFLVNDVKKFIHFLDEKLEENLRAPQGTLSIAIFDNKDLAKIHLDFLQDSSETDVITFDGNEEGFAGEICVSAQCAKDSAAQFDTTANTELCLYIAHGYLHLAGLDDLCVRDSKQMRIAEKKALTILSENIKKTIFQFS